MTTIAHLVETPLAKALGWTVFHSLWEGALAALLLLAGLLVIRSPRARYTCACTAMLGVLAAFVLTFIICVNEGERGTNATLSLPRVALDNLPQSPVTPARFRFADVPPWLAPIWMAGVLLFQLRGAAAWIFAERLRRRGICSAPGLWLQRLDQLRARLEVSKPVALLETCLSDVPAVVGYLRPVILIPAGLLAGMPASHLEAVLMHELAHIRRFDYLANLLQTVVESFLFYHPAAWWMAGVIRAEREKCCDDLVVAASGNAHDYAAALTALEQARWTTNEAILAATGGNLMKRIHRLLYRPKTSALAPVFSAVILMLAVIGALAAWQAQSPTPGAHAAAQSKADRYALWLSQDVVYIIAERERAAFLSLKSDPERDHFIEQFWERRNPVPGSPDNAFKNEHYRRIGYVDMHFGWRNTAGWKTDRGRMYITFGPPDEIEAHLEGQPAGAGLQATNVPTEEWLYHSIKGVGTNVIMEFVDKERTGDFRMTTDPNPEKGTLVRKP